MSKVTETQCTKLLEILQHQPITTIEARALFIMHPSGRVKDLKDKGFNIATYPVNAPHGSKRKIAKYVLFSGGADAE
jgi:hypothetical protein